jgi:hypothetical protein
MPAQLQAKQNTVVGKEEDLKRIPQIFYLVYTVTLRRRDFFANIRCLSLFDSYRNSKKYKI